MLNDTLRNTKYYQNILKEGREEGLEEGIEEGRREERQRELQREREALVDIVLDRFPQMVRLFKKQVDTIEDPSLLLRLRAVLGTDEAEVLGACYSGILRLEGVRAIAWVERFLAGGDDNAAEAAVVSLCQSEKAPPSCET